MKQRLTAILTLILTVLLAAGQLPVLAFTVKEPGVSLERNMLGKFLKPAKQDVGKPAPRPAGESSTLLPDGRILVLGGEGEKGALASAEIRDNRSGAVTRLFEGMAHGRAWHTATVLPDGTVFIFGGVGAKGKLVGGAEIFNPETRTFTQLTANDLVPRAFHTATLLTDGRVLIAGGSNQTGESIKQIELWEPGKNTRSISKAKFQEPRTKATASLRADGNVLFSSGSDESGTGISSSEIYSPENDATTWLPSKPVESENGAVRPTFSFPADGTLNVDTDARLALRFSKPLQVETVSQETVKLAGPIGNVPVRIVAGESGRLVFVTPLAALEADASFHLSIDGATDTDSQKLTFTSISFKTKTKSQPCEPSCGTVPQVIDADSWIPGAENFKSNWTSGRTDSEAEGLPALQAAAGETALAGKVRALSGNPLPNVTLQSGDRIAVTDSTGRFLLPNLAAGRSQLTIQGHTASKPGKRYGTFDVLVDITAGKTTVLPYTIWLPVLDDQNAVSLPVPTNREIGITTPRVPGMEVRIPADAVLRMPAGAHHMHGLARQELTSMAITPIPADRTPFPLPAGVSDALVFTLQLHGARIEGPHGENRPGLRIVYPNYLNLPAGDRVEFWNYDPVGPGWYMYGHGTVTPDRRQVIPDPGVELQSMYCISFMVKLGIPALWPTLFFDGDGDPVDLATGLFVYSKTDLVLPDVIPIELSRTYRQNDSVERSFGKGANNPYDMFIYGDTANYGEIIMPDGGRVHFDKIPNSNPWLYECTTTYSQFYKATMKLIANAPGYIWEVKLLDGTIYQFAVKVLYGDIFGVHESINRLSLIQDRFGNKLTITRDDNLRLLRVTSPNGRWVEFGYSDTSNRVATATDNAGHVVDYLYDAGGRLWKVTDANGGVTEYTYDSNDRMLTIKDPRNIVYLTNEYDATSGRVTRQTLADTGVYQFAYTVNGNGKVTQTDVTDPRNYIRRTTFNADGYSLTDTFAVGTAVQQTYTYQRQAGTNAMLNVTDPLNRVSALTYDAQNNVTSVTRMSGTSDAVTATMTYEPTFNEVATFTDPLNHTTSFSYDTAGNLTNVSDPLNHQVTFTYNSAGQMLTASDALNRTVQFGYDTGDLVSITDALNHTVNRYVDSAGRVASVSTPLGEVTRFGYDNLNQAIQGTNAAGSVSALSHDANGNVLTATDARNNPTTYIYDSMNRVATYRDPLLHDETYQYDLNGNLSQVTDRKSQITQFTYDALNRLTQVTYADASTTSYTYDAGNRVTQVTDSVAGTITYGYDNLDRLTSETAPEGTVNYTYDAAGRLASLTVSGQPSVSYTYDNADRLTQVTQGSSTVAIAYDAVGRRTSLTLPNGVVTEYGYDLASHLTSLTYKLGGNTIGSLTYAYDADGRRASTGGSFARTLLPQPVSSATYNAANQQLTFGSQTNSYDLNGNQTSNGTNTYTWNARNALTALTGPQVSASFQYNGAGQRTNTTVNGTTTGFLYGGGNIVQQQSSSGTTNVLTAGNEVFSRSNSSGTFSPLVDGLGSTLSLIDTSGAIQTEYAYDPFGKAASTGEAIGEAIDNLSQFAGMQNDGTGLQFNGADYYDPTSQRLIGETPFAGDNPYSIAGNSPVNGNGAYVPFNILRDPFSADHYILNASSNTLSDLLFLDKFAEWSGIVGNHCLPVRDRIFAGAKIIALTALLAGSGPLGRLAGRGIGLGARLIGIGGGEAAGRGAVVIGENMERVQLFASKVGAETFEGTSMEANQLWIQEAQSSGKRVIDIGPDFARRLDRVRQGLRPDSPFYNMERMSTKGYENYIRAFERTGKYQGTGP